MFEAGYSLSKKGFKMLLKKGAKGGAKGGAKLGAKYFFKRSAAVGGVAIFSKIFYDTYSAAKDVTITLTYVLIVALFLKLLIEIIKLFDPKKRK